jgi:hypothetical protein
MQGREFLRLCANTKRAFSVQRSAIRKLIPPEPPVAISIIGRTAHRAQGRVERGVADPCLPSTVLRSHRADGRGRWDELAPSCWWALSGVNNRRK